MTIITWGTRLAFASFGTFGLATVFPNVMISDPGTTTANITSSLCLSGSMLMMISGVFGAFHHTKYMPLRVACYTGGLGLGLQIIPMFAYYGLKKRSPYAPVGRP